MGELEDPGSNLATLVEEWFDARDDRLPYLTYQQETLS